MQASQGRLAFFLAAAFCLLSPAAFSDSVLPEFYLAGNGGADRCATKDCMCRVKPGPVPSNLPKLDELDRRHSVYFPTAVHEFDESQQRDLRDFLGRMENLSASSASVMAYTDGCGTASYNKALANRRLSTALGDVKKVFSVRSTVVHPEAPPECPLQSARRVDIIAHTQRRLTTAIDRVPADVYLIDASGSMWPTWRKWTDVINASFKPGGKIYVSKVSGCRNGQQLNSVKPAGGTEIWYAYYSIIDKMKPGQTLAIISDFDSDIPIKQWERDLIASKVRERGINVVVIRPGK